MTEEEYEQVYADARAEIEGAIYKVLAAREAFHDGDLGDEAPFLTGWGVVYEFTSTGFEERNQTADGVIMASNAQSRATSRGLFELGVDHYRRDA